MARWLLLALVVVLTGGCSLLGGGPPPVNVLIPVAEREPAPDVSAETLTGEPLALADMEGPVVVNFWASWCGPCANEAPDLARVAAGYADDGVHVVGVNLKDQRAAAQAFERDFEVPYPSWFDNPGTIAAAFGGIGPSALPSTVILDADHRVAVRLLGQVDQTQLADHLDALLAET